MPEVIASSRLVVLASRLHVGKVVEVRVRRQQRICGARAQTVRRAAHGRTRSRGSRRTRRCGCRRQGKRRAVRAVNVTARGRGRELCDHVAALDERLVVLVAGEPAEPDAKGQQKDGADGVDGVVVAQAERGGGDQHRRDFGDFGVGREAHRRGEPRGQPGKTTVACKQETNNGRKR